MVSTAQYLDEETQVVGVSLPPPRLPYLGELKVSQTFRDEGSERALAFHHARPEVRVASSLYLESLVMVGLSLRLGC